MLPGALKERTKKAKGMVNWTSVDSKNAMFVFSFNGQSQ